MQNEQAATPAENSENIYEPETDGTPVTAEEAAEQSQTDGSELEQEPLQEPDNEGIHRDHENRVQKRIDKLTREKYELKGRLEALEHMYAQQNTSASGAANDGKPARDMYPSDESYVEALTDWKLEQRLPYKMQEIAGQHQETIIQQAFIQKEASVKKDYADYDSVIAESADVRIPAEIVPSIITSEYGPDIRYYLAKNPEMAEALNHVPPYIAIKEIGRIEAAIAAHRHAALSRSTRQTKTPPPISPVRSGGAAAEHDLDRLSMKDFIKRREQMRNDLHKR